MKKILTTISLFMLGLTLTGCLFNNKELEPVEEPKIESIDYVGQKDSKKEYLIRFDDGSTQLIYISGEEDVITPEFTVNDLYLAAVLAGYEGDELDFIFEFASGEVTTNYKSAIRKGLKSSVSIISRFTKTERVDSFFGLYDTITSEYASAGSGIVYKLDKEAGNAYIITNYHVVYDADSDAKNKVSEDIEIYLYGLELEKYKIPATYVGGSDTYDIAVLKINNSEILKESSVAAATYKDSDTVEAGDVAIAIGNAAARGISVTQGIVSKESEYITMASSTNQETDYRVMRVDTAINSGNSGGGLFNDKGEVIGIVNAKMVDSSIEGIGYAIPANIVFGVADNILYYADNKLTEKGEKIHLGVVVEIVERQTTLDDVMDKIIVEDVIKIKEITKESLASKYFQINDEIVSITVSGKVYNVNRLYQISDILLKVRSNDKLIFAILRDDTEIDLEIVLSADDFKTIE